MLFGLVAPIASACLPLLAGSTVARTLVEEKPTRDLFGSSVALVGDVDGDGREDWLVGAPLDDPEDAGAGSAWLYSGKDGSVLWSGVGWSAWDGFGDCVSALGDVDGDEVTDFSVGAPCRSNGRPGYVRIYAGSDRRRLRELHGDAGEVLFGLCVAGVGDVDGDDVADLAVGILDGSDDPGVVRVYSGRTGALVHTLPGNTTFGFSLTGVGDVDGDLVPDFCAGEVAWPDGGAVTMFSGHDGRALWRIEGSGPPGYLGFSMSSAGDADADGVEDLRIGVVSL